MKINLRRAAKLRNRLQSVISGLDAELNQTNSTVNILDQDAVDQLSKHSEEYSASISKYLVLTDLYFSIRNRIAESNSSSGIDSLLTQKMAVENKKKVLNKITGQTESSSRRRSLLYGSLNEVSAMPSKDQMQARISGMLEKFKISEHSHTDVLSFSVVSSSLIESSRKNSMDLTAALDTIQEKIDAINSTNYIELEDSEMSFLQSESIVV